MLNNPLYLNVLSAFKAILARNGIPITLEPYYLKWLKYYLDFCEKYRHVYENPSSLPLFLDKLRQKGQSAPNIHQAEQAIRFYYNLTRQPSSTPGKRQDESIKPLMETIMPANTRARIAPSLHERNTLHESTIKTDSAVNRLRKKDTEIGMANIFIIHHFCSF
jgi:hypothetical protein